MPVSWEQLPSLKGGSQWTIATAREYLSFQKTDPWADYWSAKQTLTRPMKILSVRRIEAALLRRKWGSYSAQPSRKSSHSCQPRHVSIARRGPYPRGHLELARPREQPAKSARRRVFGRMTTVPSLSMVKVILSLT